MNFNDITKMYDVYIQIHKPTDAVRTYQQQTLSAPRFVIEQQFISLVEQAIYASVPIKVTMRRIEREWNQYEGKMTDMEYSMEFSNNSYIAFYPDEFEEKE